ncbi:MAG TPA: hypothetical protein VFY52_07270 [Thermoleophilaceae bacterium]|nr:hypothetical protein [Thermoleophilaceae bacterium]
MIADTTTRRPAGAGLFSYKRTEAGYAWPTSPVFCTTTSPVVIVGGFGRAVSSVVVARDDDHEAILNHALIQSRRRERT